MGIYLNPGNGGFQEILQSEYVDKADLIALVNKAVRTMELREIIARLIAGVKMEVRTGRFKNV